MGEAFAGVTVFDEPYRCAQRWVCVLMTIRFDCWVCVLMTIRFDCCCSACVDSHALIIITEWKEFATYDYSRIYSTMTHPSHIWDGRNLLPLQQMQHIGFNMHTIGRRA